MFEILTDKLNQVFRALGSRGKLTEKDVDEALRQVRLSLLPHTVSNWRRFNSSNGTRPLMPKISMPTAFPAAL
ncbi:MAG: signal recognition particle receptor subunit alpha [Chloroflexi bacterium]|nr:signal recognition particle receptor subunit alpha [Chloroflexota bacterium]